LKNIAWQGLSLRTVDG